MNRVRSLLPHLLIPRPGSTVILIIALYVVSMGWPILILQHEWLGWFPATMGSFQISTVWGSVAVCASAVWLSSAPRRAGLTEWVAASSKGASGVYRQPLVVCSVLGIAVYTLVWGTMILMTSAASAAPTDSSGASSELVLVLPIAWASAIVWSAVGVALGRFVWFEAAIGLSVILSYLGYVIPAYYLTNTPLGGVALLDQYSWLTQQPGDGQLIARLLLWSAAAVLLIALALNLRRTLIAAGMTTAAGLGIVALVGSTITPIPGASDLVCEGEAPRVCTVAAAASVLPDFADTITDALTVVPENFRPSAVQPGTSSAGVIGLAPTHGYQELALRFDKDETLAKLGEALFNYCPVTTLATNDAANLIVQERALVKESMILWWRLEHGVSINEDVILNGANWLYYPELEGARDRGQALATLSTEDRTAWFRDNETALRACSDQDIDWP